MAKLPNSAEQSLTDEIEQRLQNWLAGLEVADDFDLEQAHAQLEAEINPYIAVSRETGAGGSQIIRDVAEALGFYIVDKRILDYLAERYKFPRDMFEKVDEKVCSWITEAFGIWLAQRIVSQSNYVRILGRFVLTAAHNANAIFAGRGVQFILPREKGLTVRIVAPLDQRIESIMERAQINRIKAERYIRNQDAGRREFVRHHFQQDITNPELYDLVINTKSCTCVDAVGIIVGSWNERFGNQSGEIHDE